MKETFWTYQILPIKYLAQCRYYLKRIDVTARRMLMGSSASPAPIRLYSVAGHDGRANDVIYCQPRSCSKGGNASVVVFFGGDMQDFSENMQSHRDSKNYLKWNLEDSALIMQKKFPHSHFVTIRPSRIEYKTISCYGNFVPSNNCGAPDHTPMNFALQHLEKLLEHVSDRLRSMSESELNAASISYNPAPICEETDTEDNTIQTSDDLNVKPRREEPRLEEPLWFREDLQLQQYDIGMIGFSKGCVVLNQFIYEFHYLKTLTPDDQVPMGIVHRIKDMYWLDGGHSGGKNTWITSRPLLETLARLDIKIHVHVSPYQIQDDRRPWIKKEEKAFSDLLKRLGAPIERCVHFENVTPNLYSHFDVITAFKKNDDSIAASN